jgi:hypothetical protein
MSLSSSSIFKIAYCPNRYTCLHFHLVAAYASLTSSISFKCSFSLFMIDLFVSFENLHSRREVDKMFFSDL